MGRVTGDRAAEGRRRRTGLIVGAGAVGIVLLVFVLYWFAPQTLLLDREVADELPVGAASPPAPDREGAADVGTTEEAAGTPQQVVERARGSFSPLSHPGEGEALLLELADGSFLVRFEGLVTDNGPDLRVYLSAAPADADPILHEDEFVDLGPLKGNRGDQNYDVPADVDVTDYQSVVVWCRRFSVGFAVAPLEA